MFSKISILHISDIHKKKEDDFKNLFRSMVKDCNRYVQQGITKPSIIVVSGDLIRGGSPAEIKKQYQEAFDFLNDMTDFFLGGDKRRIIIVPGNHDVDWNVSKAQMKDVPHTTDKEKEEYKKVFELFRNDKAPRHGWNWEEMCLQTYEDEVEYNKRFKMFADFYNTFYRTRNYALNPSEQYDIFDIPEAGLCFVGFNSCYLNDHLNKAGQICPKCVTSASEDIKKKQGRIIIAVWHHNTYGRPRVDNYLDNRILAPVIDMGAHIALHGHQHYSGVVEEYKNAFKDGKLLMFSTGSLYGAHEQLSYGAPRQYNILELERTGENLKLIVHLREDDNEEEFEIPSWQEGRIRGLGQSSWSTHIPFPKQPLDMDRLSDLMIEGMDTGNYKNVIDFLEQQESLEEDIRILLFDFKIKNGNADEVIETIGNPNTRDEAMMLIKAAKAIDDENIYKEVRDLNGIKNSSDPHVRKMRDYLYKD